jgi:hypothetical protein
MTTKNEEAIYTLYEERGDLCDDKVIASINERPFYLQANLDDINDQIKLIEHIRPEYQELYFRKVFTDVICEAYEADKFASTFDFDAIKEIPY